jgi:murein DD-endopeptidase MepM/ murein hydrolase activator NlpD
VKEAVTLLQPHESNADEWIHPLYGPERQMPSRNTRRFGSAREGLRPEECRDGHCGVDLGHKKGDSVLAVHDGVVEVAQRDDSGRSGRYLRINHTGGSVVSSYMHQHSGPHLHFAVSVRSLQSGQELYIDPEPLLHLWSVKTPKKQKEREAPPAVLAALAE